jgi:hypothetical protein
MRSTLTPAPLLTLLALAPAVVLAHHGWSSYDSSKVLTIVPLRSNLDSSRPRSTAIAGERR